MFCIKYYFFWSLFFVWVLSLNAQIPTVVPLELRAQFNGQYDYKIIGNTLNELDNKVPGPCEMLTQSSASLNLSTGQTVEAAYLYWSGIGDGTFDPIVELNGNNITADEINVVDPQQGGNALYYGSFKNITNLVDQQGNGIYNFSDLELNPIIGNYCSTGQYYAGWSILVIYKDTSLPTQQVNIYDGLASVYGQVGANTTTASINLESLNVVSTQNARMGFLAWNGSPNSFFNESISFNGNLLSDPPLNPIDNPFNGTNSYTGANDLYNMDLDVFDISNFIQVGDTDGNITFTSTLDRLIQNVVTVTRSELPDATVDLNDISNIDACDDRNITLEVSVNNPDSSKELPANTPVSVYVLDQNDDEVFLNTFFTQNIIPVDGLETLLLDISIPDSIPENTSLILKVNTLQDGSNPINESNLLNNSFTTSFNIAQQPLVNNAPNSLSVCGNISTGESIDLTQNNLSSLGLSNPSDLNIQYFTSDSDAQNATNPISDAANFSLATDPQSIFIRIENAEAPACFTVDNFSVSYEDTPEIQQTINLHQCQQDNTTITFDLTANNASAIGVADPGNTNISYHETLAEAQNDVNAITNPSDYSPLNNSQTIYIRPENTNNSECFSTASFAINTFTAIINNVNDFEVCRIDQDTANFVLVENSSLALGNQDPSDYNLSYHLNAADAQSGNNAITDPTDYDNLSNPQDIWLRLDNTAAPINCFSTAQFSISVANAAPINFSPTPLEACDDNNYGFTEFDLSTSIDEITFDNANIAVSFHLSSTDAENNANPISSPFTNTVPDNQTIFFRTEESGNGCSFTGSLDLEVFATPGLDENQPTLSECAVDGDTATFNLTDINEQIIINNNAADFQVDYFSSENDALNNTNAIVDPSNFSNASNPQTLWIRVSDEQSCSSIAAFELEVLTGVAIADNPLDGLEICSENTDELSAVVDLTQLDAAINANPDEPTLVEYFSSSTAVDNDDPIPNPESFAVDNASTTVFARVIQVETLCESEVIPIDININPLPQVDLTAFDGQVICIDAADGEVIDNDFSPPVIETGLADSDLSFSWQRNGEDLEVSSSSLTVDQPGEYSVVVTDNATGCQASSSAEILESSIPDFNFNLITDPFSANPVVEVSNIIGIGDFDFRLDDGNWVSLGNAETLRFSDFDPGEHQITGRSILGCGKRTKSFQVIGYRSFFTPDQDGFNDHWNISSLKNQRDALILIYDRYGKLLKQLRPTDNGWDGTYNGNPMPSNDYWFSVKYTDPQSGKKQVFRGSLTLKR